MSFVSLAGSPLAPCGGETRVFLRDQGAGPPLLFLHGGWGYGVFPIDAQIAALSPHVRIIAPDRTGYGRSTPIADLPVGFHLAAARETLALMRALDVARPIVWGHSDGAVIAAMIAIERPDAVRALILESCHLLRRKPSSTAFFDAMMRDPGSLGERVTALLALDHGERWRDVLRMNGRAWRAIAETAGDSDDLFDGALTRISAPTLILHGDDDPRTEPGELQALSAAVPHALRAIVPGGGHCPHIARQAAHEATAAVDAFVRGIVELRASHRAPPRVGPARESSGRHDIFTPPHDEGSTVNVALAHTPAG